MRKLLVALLLLFPVLKSFCQYHIMYHYSYFDPVTGEQRETVDGADVVWQDYYAMDGYTKSVFDGGNIWMQIYQRSNNLWSRTNMEGEIISKRSKDLSEGLKEVILLDSTATVLGYKCKVARFIYPKFTVTSYYSEDVKLDIESFVNHNFSDFYTYSKKLNGCIELKFKVTAENYSFEAEPVVIEKVTLAEDDFDPKRVLKAYRKELATRRDNILTSSQRALSGYSMEPVASFEAIGTTRNGAFSMPLNIKMKVPNLMLMTLEFQSVSFYFGSNGMYEWSYNPMADQVQKSKASDDEKYTEDNLVDKFAPVLNKHWDRYNLISLRDMDSVYRFVVDDEERKTFYVNKDDYLIHRWGDVNSYYLLSDYKVFEGRLFPGHLVQMDYDNPKPKFEAFYTDVKFNTPFSSTTFDIPEHLMDKVVDQSKEKTDLEYYQAGEQFLKQGTYDSAIANYKKAIHINPENKLYYNQSGVARLKKGDYYGAIADLSKSLELDDQYHTAWYNLGFTKMNLGDYKNALKDLSTAIGLASEESLYYSKRGTCYYYLGRYDTALVDFNKVVELDSSRAVDYWNLAMTNYQLKQFDGAINAFNKAEILKYSNINLYNYRGICYYSLENFDAALEDFKKAVKGDAPEVNFFSNLGNTYSKLGETKKAIAAYESALQLDSTAAEVHNLMGLALYHSESYDAAISAFSNAIKHNPNEAVYYDNRASAKEYLMNYTGAIDDYSQSLTLYPNDPDIYYRRGMAKINVNDKFDGCRDFKKAVELGSEDASEAIEEYCN